MDLAEVVIRFTSDITGFTAGANAVQQALGGLSGAADETNMTFAQKLTHGVSSAYEGFMNFGEGVARTIESVTEMNFPLMKMVQGLISNNAEMEQTNIAFTTLLHSSKAAGDYLKDLWNFAAKTPFQFQDLAQASQQMIATGFSAKQTIPDLNSMGNALSAMGRTSAGDLMQLVSIFDRMQAGSKVNARDMQELTFMGINGWGMVANAMHLTVAQVQDLSRRGKLLSTDVIPELISGFNKTFGGAMQAQALTFNGLMTTVKDNLQAAWRVIAGPLFDAAKGALQTFGNIVASDQFQNAAKNIASAIGSVFNLFGKVGALLSKAFQGLDFTPVTEGFTNIISVFKMAGQWIQFFFNQMTKSGSAFGPMIAGVHGLLQSGLNVLGNIFQGIYVALSAVIVGITNGTGPLGFLKNAFQQIWSIVGGQFKEDLKTIGNVFQQIGNWIKTSLWPALQSIMPSFQNLANVFVSQVLPALTNLWTVGQHISNEVLPLLIPPLETIVTWAIQLAGIIGQGLTIAFEILAPIINTTANVIKGLVDFFTKTEVGGDILKATLIALSIPLGILALGFTALAIVAIADFIASIPAMVAGFIAGAAGAWTMAAGVMAVAFPILAVIAVIALIILAITHWTQIVQFLQVVWNTVVAFLGNVFGAIGNAIGNFFSGLGTKVHDGMNAIGNFFMDVWKGYILGLQIIWNTIVSVVQQALQFLLNTFLAPFRAIGALFSWLYEHNYYVKKLVDTIHAYIVAGLVIIQTLWNNFVKWLTNLWTTIVKDAENIWNAITKTISDAINFVVGWIDAQWIILTTKLKIAWAYISAIAEIAWKTISDTVSKPVLALIKWIQDQWKKASDFLGQQWNTFKDMMGKAWKAVSDTISNAWNTYVSGPLGNLWNNITGAVGKWFSQAYNWGVNLIQGFINGLLSKVQDLEKTASGMASSIAKYLGFHSPAKEGPGSELDEWPKNMMTSYAKGIVNAIPLLQSAVTLAVTPIAQTLSGQGLQTSGYSAPGVTSTRNGQPVNVYLDGKQFAALITDHLGNAMLSQLRSSANPRGALT